MKYVLNSDVGKIKTNKDGKQLKKVIIDDKEYPYNPSKPFAGTLINKLEQVEKTAGYKRFNILDKASKGIAVRKSFKTIFYINIRHKN